MTSFHLYPVNVMVPSVNTSLWEQIEINVLPLTDPGIVGVFLQLQLNLISDGDPRPLNW